MSTPAIRAIVLLALPLLVARVGADDLDAAVPADHLALLTHSLDARAYLHQLLLSLLVAVGDSTPAEVAGGDLHLDAIPGEDADAVHPHLPGAVGQHRVAVLELDLEHGVRERLFDRPLEHDRIFLGLGQVELRFRFLWREYNDWPGMRIPARARRANGTDYQGCPV